MSKKREESDLSSDSEDEVKQKDEVEKVPGKSDEGKPAQKKRKVSSEASEEEEEEKPKSSGLEEGAFWVNEKRLKRVQVRSFKGKALVDIRELYMGKEGYAPGRKGISLSIEDWRALIHLAPHIDKEIRKIT